MIDSLRTPSLGIGAQPLFFGLSFSSSANDNSSRSENSNPPPPSSPLHSSSDSDKHLEEGTASSPGSSSIPTMEPSLSHPPSNNIPQPSLPRSQPPVVSGNIPRALPKLLPLLRSPPDMIPSFVSNSSHQMPSLSAPVEPLVGPSDLNSPHNRDVVLAKRKYTTFEEDGLAKKQKSNASNSADIVPTQVEAPPHPSVIGKSLVRGKVDTGKKAAASGDRTGSRKRRADKDGQNPSPRKRNRPSKKPKKGESAKERLSQDIWMRILEYTPPQFLSKMRLVSKEFKDIVDKFDSIYINCRKENYGYDMPSPPEGLTERQYINLLGGKGCMEPGCDDKNSSKTHWSWLKRWCLRCWKKKIIREDRIIKYYSGNLSRQTVMDLLECIPVGMHDSFEKPHDYIEDPEARTRVISRMYHCYVREDFLKIKAEYEALDPGPYKENPNLTPEEQAAAQATHQKRLDELEDCRAQFISTRQDKAAEHMEKVMKIEEHVRAKRESVKDPNAANRQARRELFTRRAREELPHIDEAFVQKTEAFKAATRIFRDPGSERGWRALKPKIEAEWEKEHGKDAEKATAESGGEGLTTKENDSTGTDSNGSGNLGMDSSTGNSQNNIGNNAGLLMANNNLHGSPNGAGNIATPSYSQVWFRGHIPRSAIPRGARRVVRYGVPGIPGMMPRGIPSILNDPNLPPGMGVAVMSNPTGPSPPGMRNFSLPPIASGSSFGQPSGQFNNGYHQGTHNYNSHFPLAQSSSAPPQSSSNSFQPSSSSTSSFPLTFPSARPQFPGTSSAANYPQTAPPAHSHLNQPQYHSMEEYRLFYNQVNQARGGQTSNTPSTWDTMTSAARPRGQQPPNSFMGANGSASSSSGQ